MASGGIDFTLFFRRLTQLAGGQNEDSFLSLFTDKQMGKDWLKNWRNTAQVTKSALAKMRAANPIYIPRNHRVEEAIRAAEDAGDYCPFKSLAALVAAPFTQQDDQAHMEAPPQDHEIIRQNLLRNIVPILHPIA